MSILNSKVIAQSESNSHGKGASQSVIPPDNVQTTSGTDEVFSFPELCLFFQKPKSSMYALVAAGRAPQGFHVGRDLRFRKSVVLAWIEAQELSEYETRAS